MSYELKDYLNAINFSKVNLLDTDDETWAKKYPPYVINKCLSMFYDCIAQAKLKNLEYVKEYYGYSNEKAKDALNILTEKQIEVIKESLKKGGRTK